MSVNVSSLTCYALLSAIESDLRELITAYCDEGEAALVLGEDLVERAIGRRAKERRGSTSVHLSSLLPYIDFEDAYNALRRIHDRLPDDLAQALARRDAQFRNITPVRNRIAHSRPLEMDDLPLVVDFSVDLVMCPGYDWHETVAVRVELDRNPGFVLGLTPDLVADEQTATPHNLPPADFDETGFLGRRDLRRDLIRALKGPWPVVSILGDGGLGKTALALQVAYDLLDEEDCPFDAIVWTSAKNATLTTSEIVRIEGAIQDSLGLFAGAVTELAGDIETEDVITEVLEYLSTFRVLLVLDNLETVIDDNIREFLKNLPHGSKVFITSRIGVGTENPFKLLPLQNKEANHLLRTLARVRNVDSLKSLSDDESTSLTKKMNFHPGYIKWFVSGVQSGQAPENLVEDNGLVLEYCMENVFQYLGDDAKATLRSMLVLPGVHTLAELAFLNDFTASRMMSGVLELTTTNFLTQMRGGAAGTGYSLSDFAKEYLKKNYQVETAERQWLLERHQSLYQFGGDLQEAHSRNPYSPETIEIRGAGDFHAAQSLRSALDLANRGLFDQAIDICQEASELAAGYHEVQRIKGYIYEISLSYSEAFDAYDRARDLAEKSPHVRYFFGKFLVTSGYNPRAGLTELQRAARLDQDSSEVQLAVAEAHLQLGNYTDAVEVAGVVIAKSSGDDQYRQSATSLAINASMHNTRLLYGKGDWATMAEVVESLINIVKKLPKENLSTFDLDRFMIIGNSCAEGSSKSGDDFLARRCREFADTLLDIRRTVQPSHMERRVGIVKSKNSDKGFAFVTSNKNRFFLHASQLMNRDLFDSIPDNATVAFTSGKAPSADQNPPALQVNWLF